MRRVLLIDGDIVAFQQSAAAQRTYVLPEADAPVVSACPDETLSAVRSLVDRLWEELRADEVIVCLSDDFTNFRKKVLPTYKAARVGSSRPALLYDMKDALAQHYRVERWPTLEADDVMGILATQEAPEEKRCIVSWDKDMLTIPGFVYLPNRMKKPQQVSEVEANRFWLTQAITGDPTDGYKGCPGVGPKSKFVQAIQEEETLDSMWGHVLAAYESKGLTADDALAQARCARILRHEDWDGRHPILWKPAEVCG